MGETVRVSSDGLYDSAAMCDSAAAALASDGAPIVGGPAFQASSAAVTQGNGVVKAVAAALATRATHIGEKLRAAADSYARTDGAAANQLAAVSQTIAV